MHGGNLDHPSVGMQKVKKKTKKKNRNTGDTDNGLLTE